MEFSEPSSMDLTPLSHQRPCNNDECTSAFADADTLEEVSGENKENIPPVEDTNEKINEGNDCQNFSYYE